MHSAPLAIALGAFVVLWMKLVDAGP